MKIPSVIKSASDYIKSNAVEIYALALINAGLPLIAVMYVDIKLAITVSVIVNLTLCILALRKAK